MSNTELILVPIFGTFMFILGLCRMWWIKNEDILLLEKLITDLRDKYE